MPQPLEAMEVGLVTTNVYLCTCCKGAVHIFCQIYNNYIKKLQVNDLQLQLDLKTMKAVILMMNHQMR